MFEKLLSFPIVAWFYYFVVSTRLFLRILDTKKLFIEFLYYG